MNIKILKKRISLTLVYNADFCFSRRKSQRTIRHIESYTLQGNKFGF